ncbi:pilus assembly protein TadG-related protein [Arthrobacter oryzae]|uniref:Flp pilus assembly protein TadG n=1 Tax=Arthrobacter oryzae TaxID=409290 RepID=A0A495EVD0_9MICC|nr:pilus assembly protein TadG-related protein [Arthrobacter oryzae]RKR20553.1 Flp pilus assembly protein TadG [Arthrobacter oryzae]
MPRLRGILKNTRGKESERGAAGVLVAVLMLVLIGAGALAVDTGEIYAEEAQLQNAADAGALAVAQRCHAAGTCTVSQALGWARELAGPNSNDGVSAVDSVDLSVPGQVRVVTSTLGTDGAGFLTKLFASALNAPPATVRTGAAASWAAPTSGSGFPLAISDNCYNLSGAVATGDVQRISYKPGGTCTGPSGTQIPGGWGWLDRSSPCVAVTATGNNQVGSNPGNSPPGDCNTILGGWITTILAGGDVKVAFPVFDDATNQGQNGTFHVIGYATFKMWGWKFGNNGNYEFRDTAGDPNMTSALACSGGNDRCIIGQFVKFETINSTGNSSGGGTDLGTVDIKLIK